MPAAKNRALIQPATMPVEKQARQYKIIQEALAQVHDDARKPIAVARAYVVAAITPCPAYAAIATTRIVGPALGGVVISLIGIGQAFLCNALSFIPVITALLLLRTGEFYASARSARGNIFRQVGEGIRYAVHTPSILIILLTVTIIGTFGYSYPVILPLLAKYVLHAGATGLGMLTSAVGIGSLVGAVVMAATRGASQRSLLGTTLVFSVVLLAVGVSSSLPLTLVLLVMLGSVGIVHTSSSNSSLQLHAPGPLRGRVVSLFLLLGVGTTPIGSFLVGVLSARFGVQPTIVLLGVVCLVGSIAVCAYAWWSTTTLHQRSAAPQTPVGE